MLNVSIWRGRARSSLVEAYGNWVSEWVLRGWDAYLATLMFHDLPGSMQAQIAQMHHAAMGVFSRLATRMVRKPRSADWAPLLPRAVFAPDLPVTKHSPEPPRDPPTNDGLHMHGIILANRSGRLKEPLDQHFEQKRSTYLIGTLRTIDLRIIDRDPWKATEYALKGLKRSCFNADHLLVLPRSLGELQDKVLGGA